MEPAPDKGVGAPVRRLSPTALAAIALALIIAILVALMALRSRGQDDRLTGNQLAEAQEEPEKRCAGQATYDLIKRELFRRAAELRGSDQAAFGRLAGYSAVRMEGPILRDENAEVGSVTCSGSLTLDLPPGVAVVGGRRTLSAEILYTIQPAADGSGNVVTLANADDIVTPLATLARVGAAAPGELDPTTATNTIDEGSAEPGAPLAEPVAPDEPSEPRMPESEAPPASANPSFNCARARTRGEIAVCSDSGLAALDRRMASQFNNALSRADPAERALLIRTRDAFLSYRDRCPNNACIAQTYRGRMREIADIMAGRWQPPR
jgi:uncharacterized protein YecT (DUF1311 family)